MQVTFKKSHFCFTLCQHVWPLQFKLHQERVCERAEAICEGKHASNGVFSQPVDWGMRYFSVCLRAWCRFHQLPVLPLYSIAKDIMTSVYALPLIQKAHIRRRFWKETCVARSAVAINPLLLNVSVKMTLLQRTNLLLRTVNEQWRTTRGWKLDLQINATVLGPCTRPYIMIY